MELFCQEYVKNKGNGTQAAITAGYSKKTAQEIAAENLLKPIIISRIDELRGDLGEKFEDDAAKVINELKAMGFFDVSEVLSLNGNCVVFKSWESIKPEARRMIQSVSDTKDGIKVTFYPKHQALRDLAEIFGLKTGKNPLPGGPKTLEEIVEMSEEELAKEINIRKKALKVIEDQL